MPSGAVKKKMGLHINVDLLILIFKKLFSRRRLGLVLRLALGLPLHVVPLVRALSGHGCRVCKSCSGERGRRLVCSNLSSSTGFAVDSAGDCSENRAVGMSGTGGPRRVGLFGRRPVGTPPGRPLEQMKVGRVYAAMNHWNQVEHSVGTPVTETRIDALMPHFGYVPCLYPRRHTLQQVGNP